MLTETFYTVGYLNQSYENTISFSMYYFDVDFTSLNYIFILVTQIKVICRNNRF